MKTKHLIKFLNNATHLDVDLEFTDILKTSISKGQLKTNENAFIFDNVDKEKHHNLSRRKNTDHSRTLVANHLKSSIRASFIKSIYEGASVYFQDILKAATKKGINIERLIGDHNKNFSYKEIVEFGSYSKILDTIALGIFRQLENERSTKALIEKMAKKLGLSVDNEIINNAMPYFEIRHKLVHAEGKADKLFCSNFPEIEAEEDKPIHLSYKIVSDAKQNITTLIKEFDKQIVLNEIIANSELQH